MNERTCHAPVGLKIGSNLKANSAALTGILFPAFVGTSVSLMIGGYVFGISNNLFHLGIVAENYSLLQFQNDAFNQSLKYFASGFWLLLRGSAKIVDPAWLFFVLHFASRYLCFIGFLLAASALGIISVKQRMLFALLLGLTSLMQGASVAGDGGLFFSYFTHSEIANGLTLITLYFCVRGRLSYAIAVNGLVFFINAFIAFWNLFPIAAFLLTNVCKLFKSRVELAKLSIGVLVFAALSVPVLMMILGNPEAGQTTNFNYTDFLRGYYPYHFFWASNGWRGNVALLIIIILGFVAFQNFGEAGRRFQLALLSFCFLYIVGIFAPAITDARFVINLHLLRSSTNIQMMAALAITVLAVSWLTSAESIERNVYGPLTSLLICLPKSFLPIVLLALITRPFASGVVFKSRWVAVVAVLGIALHALFVGVRNQIENRQMYLAVREWREVGIWARHNTDIGAKFLLPVVNPHVVKIGSDVAKGAGSEVFEFYAERASWVDFKRGAAVMWSPSYFFEWKERMSEVAALQNPQQLRPYAKERKLQYIVVGCERSDVKSLYRTERLCVLSSEP